MYINNKDKAGLKDLTRQTPIKDGKGVATVRIHKSM